MSKICVCLLAIVVWLAATGARPGEPAVGLMPAGIEDFFTGEPGSDAALDRRTRLREPSLRLDTDPVPDVRSLTINGRTTDWDTIAVFVLPGETLTLQVPPAAPTAGWVANGGELNEVGPGRTEWVAPDSVGLYRLITVYGPAVKQINAFVKYPFTRMKNGAINGFTIGQYPASNPFPGFTVPDGFVEVTQENRDTPVSPRYTLGQFEPPYPAGYPKYIALREDAILKLELLTDLIAEKGHACTRLAIMCGYRTPARQRSRGGGRHSAHLYGGAVDIYVDENGDGQLDDLNGDGKSDSRDAQLLAAYVDGLEERYPELVGGVGWYRRTRSRTAFVHIDTRGERIRWGQ